MQENIHKKGKSKNGEQDSREKNKYQWQHYTWELYEVGNNKIKAQSTE